MMMPAVLAWDYLSATSTLLQLLTSALSHGGSLAAHMPQVLPAQAGRSCGGSLCARVSHLAPSSELKGVVRVPVSSRVSRASRVPRWLRCTKLSRTVSQGWTQELSLWHSLFHNSALCGTTKWRKGSGDPKPYFSKCKRLTGALHAEAESARLARRPWHAAHPLVSNVCRPGAQHLAHWLQMVCPSEFIPVLRPVRCTHSPPCLLLTSYLPFWICVCAESCVMRTLATMPAPHLLRAPSGFVSVLKPVRCAHSPPCHASHLLPALLAQCLW